MAFLGGQLLSSKPTLAQGLSRDLGQSLQGLAQHKATQMQNKQKAQLWQSLGLDPETSLGLAAQPEAIQKSILDRLEGASFGAGQQYPQQQAPIQNQMQQSQQQQPTYTPEQEQVIRRSQNPEERQKIADLFRQHNQQQAQPQQVATPNQQAGQAAAQQQAIETATKNQGVKLGATSQERAAAQKEAHALQKYEHEKYDKEVKESKDWYKSKFEESHALKQNLARLNRQETLNNSKQISNGLGASFRDTIAHGIGGKFGPAFIGIPGIDLNAVLLSPESQEFEKLSNDMLSGLKDMYGGRINQVEVEAFLKTIPSLSQSREGRQAVIDNMRRFTEDKLLALNEAKKIKAENGGVIPPDLQIEVEERISDRLDQTIEDFKNLTHTFKGEKKTSILDLINPKKGPFRGL
jgi:hypothetical protein